MEIYKVISENLIEFLSASENSPSGRGWYYANELIVTIGKQVNIAGQDEFLQVSNGNWIHAISGGQHNVLFVENVDQRRAKAAAESEAATGYQTLPAFLKTMTAAEATAFIHSSVLSGKTEAQINADIDALANTVAGMKIGLKTIGASLVAIRDILELIVRLLLFIRDLVIRFRQ